QRRRAAPPAPGTGRSRRPRAAAARLGALGGGSAGDAPLLPAVGLLPVPAHQPVMARRPHDGPRHQRAGNGRHRGRVCPPGAAHIRHGAPRRSGSHAGLRHAAHPGATGPAAAPRARPARERAGRRRADTSGATLHATAILTTVTLDGRPGEPFWATADSIDTFRQREPHEGAPASERTVVKVAYDAAALYILVRCDDGDMRGVRASQLRRAADLYSDDNVRVLIDSFDDRRSAF